MTVRFRLTEHAEGELARRGIPRTLLDQVLRKPEPVVPADAGRRAYPSQLDFGGGRIWLLRVIVDERVAPPMVVTAYRTSKIDKCWRRP